MKDFPISYRMVSILLKILGQGNHIGDIVPEIRLQVPYLDGIGTKPRKQTGTRRVTHRLLAIGPGKGNTLLSQAVDIRAYHIVAPISTQLGTEIIHRDKKHIGQLQFRVLTGWGTRVQAEGDQQRR